MQVGKAKAMAARRLRADAVVAGAAGAVALSPSSPASRTQHVRCCSGLWRVAAARRTVSAASTAVEWRLLADGAVSGGDGRLAAA